MAIAFDGISIGVAVAKGREEMKDKYVPLVIFRGKDGSTPLCFGGKKPVAAEDFKEAVLEALDSLSEFITDTAVSVMEYPDDNFTADKLSKLAFSQHVGKGDES